MKRFPFICAMILCVALMAVPAFANPPECIMDGLSGTPVSDDGIVPIYTSECTNPTCADLGYANELKADPPNAGDYNIDSNTITVARDGNFFDWSSTFGIDAVIAKGGPHANVYVYDPADTADGGLAAPADCGTEQNPQQCGLSHISFCYNDICDCETNNDCETDNKCETGVCDQCICVFTQDSVGAPCEGGKCDVDGVCVPDIPVPEFPTIALPAALLVGFIGTVLFIQGTRKQ